MLRPVLLLPAFVVLATFCRYTVRDVAFVDLGDANYRLELGLAESDPDTLGAIATSLLDSNITYETSEDAPDRTAALHHPDGRTLDLDLWDSGALDASVLRDLTDSPLRRLVLDEVFSNYAFCLLVEGADAAKNDQAREVIDGALTELGTIYHAMPKAVGELPHLTTLAHDRRSTERVLLFALGIPDYGSEPSFCVLMGRGRRVGPVLTDEEISPTAVFGILQAVGQSCECDLDRSWMQGPRVPLRWDAAAKARVAQDLGFDAENPFVRTEISGILARGPERKERAEGVTLEEALLAYEEFVIPTPDLSDASVMPEDPQAATPTQNNQQEKVRAITAKETSWAAIAIALVIGCIVIPTFMIFLAIKFGRSK
jgi:hypothetical protein